MWMTENDLAIILQAYRWKRVDVLEVWRTRKEYLPKEFVEYVLELFNNKTALKKIAPEEYALSKMHLNALFGMCITALIMGDVVFDPDTFEWSQKRVTTEMVTEHLKKLRGFKNKQYFLNYDWGCHCANASRKRLWDLIIKYDRHVMYADTDSIFTTIAIDFTEYNNEVNKCYTK